MKILGWKLFLSGKVSIHVLIISLFGNDGWWLGYKTRIWQGQGNVWHWFAFLKILVLNLLRKDPETSKFGTWEIGEMLTPSILHHDFRCQSWGNYPIFCWQQIFWPRPRLDYLLPTGFLAHPIFRRINFTQFPNFYLRRSGW